MELQVEQEMRGGMRSGGSHHKGLPADVQVGGGAGLAQPWRPRECVEQRLAQGRPQRGSGEEGRAVFSLRASTWLPAPLYPLSSPSSAVTQGILNLGYLRCCDFKGMVGDSDF